MVLLEFNRVSIYGIPYTDTYIYIYICLDRLLRTLGILTFWCHLCLHIQPLRSHAVNRGDTIRSNRFLGFWDLSNLLCYMRNRACCFIRAETSTSTRYPSLPWMICPQFVNITMESDVRPYGNIDLSMHRCIHLCIYFNM